MSIADELRRNIADLSASYAKTEAAGADMPTQRNFDNLPATIASIDYAEKSGIPPLSMNSVSDYPARDYKVYGQSVQDGTPTPDNPVEIESVGDKVNLFDISRTPDITYGALSYSESNGTLTIASVNTGGAQFVGYKMTGLDPTKTYTVSAKAKKVVAGSDGDPSLRLSLHKVNASGGLGSGIGIARVTSPNQGQTYSLVAKPADDPGLSEMFVLLYNNSSTPVTVGETSEYWDIQFEEGSTATPYTPYGKYSIPVTVSDGTNSETTNIILDEPLRKIGEYTDYIDYKNQSVVRNIAEIASYNGETISGSYMSTTGSLTTGATVDYSLTSPTTTSVSLPSLERFAGEVTVSVGTSIQPSNMWVKF